MGQLQRIGPRLVAVTMTLLCAGCSDSYRMAPRADVGQQSYGRYTSTRGSSADRRATPTYRNGTRPTYSSQAYRNPRTYSRYDGVATGGVPAYNGYAPNWNAPANTGPYNAPNSYVAPNGYGAPNGYTNGWNAVPAQPYPPQAYPPQTYQQPAYPPQVYPQQGYPQPVYPQQAYPQPVYPGQAYPAPTYPASIYQPFPAPAYPPYPQPTYPPRPASYANPPYGAVTPSYDGRSAYPNSGDNGGYSSRPLSQATPLEDGGSRLDDGRLSTSSTPALRTAGNRTAPRTVQSASLPPPAQRKSYAAPTPARAAPQTLEAQARAIDQGRRSPVASAPLPQRRPSVAASKRATTPDKPKAAPTRQSTSRPVNEAASLRPVRSDTIRFLPIIGAPATIVTPLSRHLANAARASGIVIKAANVDNGSHFLKGYLATFRSGDGVTVSYVWDVLDKTGERLHRIQGKQDIAYAGGDLWAAVPGRTLQTIAQDTIAAYRRWQGSQTS
jgi:hypothetical protein